jgi:AcrR family transcriptional regulator
MKRGSKAHKAPPPKAKRPTAKQPAARPTGTKRRPASAPPAPDAPQPPRLRTYPDEAILDAVRLERGLVTRIAARLGCSTATIYSRLRESPVIAAAVQEERTRIIDTAEHHIFRRIEDGSPDDCWKILRLLARDRGYAETTNVRLGGDPESPEIALAALARVEAVEKLGLSESALGEIADALERKETVDAAATTGRPAAPVAGQLEALPVGPGAAGAGVQDPQPPEGRAGDVVP